MGETLIVRAIVPEELREQFEISYQEENLPEARKPYSNRRSLNFARASDDKLQIRYGAIGYLSNRLSQRASLTWDFLAGVTLARYSRNMEESVQVTS